MCDVLNCAEFLHLLVSYEVRVTSNDAKHSALLKSEIEIVFGYIQSWPQRQCMCLYRDPKNFERFNLIIQSMICFSIVNLKNVKKLIEELICLTNPSGNLEINKKSENHQQSDQQEQHQKSLSSKENDEKTSHSLKNELLASEEKWILPEIEKLLLLVSKAFLLNFPLYIAYKHGGGVHSRLDEISAEEAQNLNIFCDLHDNEIPAFLLRNVSLFCNSGGFSSMMTCFDQPNLPLSTAHAITVTVSNIKIWLNYRCIIQMFIPFRSKVLQYMCKLSDQDLRAPATRSMADFVWSAVRDPLDSSINFDVDGLALAYKYFTSTTLTMRLAGMAQINSHINLFNEICTTETVGEVEIVGQKLGDWLSENQIITHLFGPNLHVEVIKQSHAVLNFLAVENQINEEHINLIWQAAQLKHCSKPVYDILPSLVKNLAPRPALHLYQLLCRLGPKEHTEQSIYIASALTKLIWSRDSIRPDLLQGDIQSSGVVVATTSSENSVSIDGSNTEEEEQNDEDDDDSSAIESHKSPMDVDSVVIGEGSGGGGGNGSSDFGVPPCKQARRKPRIEDCDDEVVKSKIEMIEEMDLKGKNVTPIKARRLSNMDENTSSDDEEDILPVDSAVRKKMRKRRKNNNVANSAQTRLAHELVEAIWGGGSGAGAVGGDSHSETDLAAINDSDCSDPQLQNAVLSHLQNQTSSAANSAGGGFIRAIAETHLNELLIDSDEPIGTYSSPMSNKSEKNMADFDDDDEDDDDDDEEGVSEDEDSPCEEELAQLVSRNHHNCLPSFGLPIAVRENEKSCNKSRQSDKVEEIDNSQLAKEDNVAQFKITEVCQPGNTLLWDLLQDEKIGQLGESLAMEAEKALGALLCFTTDRLLRTKFIEGCLQNLASNRTVIVSLRLLPKLFASFQQFRATDTHQVTMWAERTHKMMLHFFNNIKYYSNLTRTNRLDLQVLNQNGLPMYLHITQVQVRLQFLTSVFSSLGSPKSFRLSLEQVDALWEWLANDSECADCLFAWLQVQAKGIEQHALGIETLQHLYLKKLPELKPEGISMVALGLFQQLCSLARLAIAHYEKQAAVLECNVASTSSAANIVGMNHLWKIALRAHNTEVSLAAIQYINSFYMGQQLKMEREFVAQCMDHLIQAAEELQISDNPEHALMCVQRALMLLNTHLETFRRRYAFHLRRWALEGVGIASHSNLRNEGTGPPIRIILQPAGLSEKSILHMHSCDLIAELKAEISKWWERLQQQQQQQQQQQHQNQHSAASKTNSGAPVLGLLLSEGPLRIITQGQELTSEYDERSLGDVGFKDNQIIYVSLGGRGAARRKEPMDHPTLQPPPPKECLPTVLLLQPKYFEELFHLMQALGDMKMPLKVTLSTSTIQPHIKAQLLSRRIWDILAMLPTNPNLLESFKNLGKDLPDSPLGKICDTNRDQIKQIICELLDSSNLQKFMYSLHIVESLATKTKQSCCSIGSAENNSFKPIQARRTKSCSNIMPTKKCSAAPSSSSSKSSDEQHTTEEKPTKQLDSKSQGNELRSGNDLPLDDEEIKENKKPSDQIKPISQTSDVSDASSQKAWKWHEVFIEVGGMQHLFEIFQSGTLQGSHHIDDRFNEWRHDCLASLLRILCILGFEEIKQDDLLPIIPRPHYFMLQMMEVDSTLKRLASILHDETYNNMNQLQLRTGFWGRPQVVQFVMNILVSFVHSSKEARQALWSKPEYCSWLQKFILDDPEPSVRREICAGLYRICLGNSNAYPDLLGPLLQKLVSFLPIAEKMTSYHQSHPHEDGKEPYGPACRDYFWLLSRLVDTLTSDMIKNCLDCNGGTLDIEQLCCALAKSICERDFYEVRHGYQDDGLVGLLNLMSNLCKYDPPFKFSAASQQFIEKVFSFLFDLPSPRDRQKPKCKSQTARAAAYDLLVELCKNSLQNYTQLHEKLLQQHRPGPHAPYPWDYWPRDDGRSECGYVGLTNLGATCYMASCVQHLFMMPQAREAILTGSPAKKHGPTLHELQRMFAYLLESERKSYNPRSFCRVYQMDHQPLNTGEQKDMAEFFIDLVSKLEEMTPDLKLLVKKLFSGTQSNNVVSLDCGHVSRTAEEFYTVRCQVADMRNLQESLDEVTVKDTLEGDNMYTCSQCGKKVRAEKRACFQKLPQILCFNTMRYTFNMLTMLKEKVNTHFSFPMRLDMTDYVEKTLMPQQYLENKKKRERKISSTQSEKNSDEKMMGSFDSQDDDEDEDGQGYEYDLVGVTVHTGTADGGHYYSFIKERSDNQQLNSFYQQQQLQQQQQTHHQQQLQERWFLFNDAEVKPFDPSQIASECFGGEMTSKTYDSVTEKYLDFSFEKTNSAYMLFYERRSNHSDLICNHPSERKHLNVEQTESVSLEKDKEPSDLKTAELDNEKKVAINKIESKESSTNIIKSTLTEKCDIDSKNISNELARHQQLPSCSSSLNIQPSTSNSLPSTSQNNNSISVSNIGLTFSVVEKSLLNKELEEWIWQDNRNFLQDRNIFEHTYFNFMWQICGNIPQTLLMQTDVTCMAAQLSVSFFIETFIHAKEKPTMVLWVELLTKQFNASQEACEWFLSHMSTEPWWPVQVLIQCPNQMVRQMFQRLVIHVIQRLRQSHFNLYLKAETESDGKEIIGNASCITRFIKSLIHLMEHGAKTHLRHLSEFFGLLYEFSRMGDEETLFLLKIGIIRSVADFYLGNKSQDCLDTGSDNDENSSDEALSIDKARPASLDKMIALVASLVERSRGSDFRLHLSQKDYNAIAGGKGFPFLYQQIKDNINPHQTRHLIHALCRWDERLANQIITMLFASVTKHTELCGPFFKLLTLLTETQGGPSGLPCFSQLVLQRVWDAAEYCPQSALDWLAVQAPRNKIAHAWILQSAESWVEQFLMAHNNTRVRNAASFLLVSLVPSQSFRANYRAHSLHKLPINLPHRELNGDAQIILHNIINLLLRLLRAARAYTDIGIHGTAKLTAYFSLLTYCMVSKVEKLMLGPYMRALWDLFHPRLSEPSVPAHHNKHALLAFWHHAISDCPENAQIVATCPEITRNIAFNYILADHDDSEIVAYNRAMLPAYYGLLRLCCQQSRTLTRQLAAHQNLQWAFKNITPHPTQYSAAVDELFRLMTLFANRHTDATEQEQHEVSTFRRTTLAAYLSGLDARVSWGTLINALRILVDNEDDRLFVVFNGGIEMCFDALHTLHSMYHEATACHVVGDLQELLSELLLLVTTLRMSCRLDSAKKQQLLQNRSQSQQQSGGPPLKGLSEAVKRLATFLNTYNPPEIRNLALDVLKEMVRNHQLEVTQILAPIFTHCHISAQNSPNSIGPLGPFFPRRNNGSSKCWPSNSPKSQHHHHHHQQQQLQQQQKQEHQQEQTQEQQQDQQQEEQVHDQQKQKQQQQKPQQQQQQLLIQQQQRQQHQHPQHPRPPRPMVQMSIPQNQMIQKGIDKDYDQQLEAFYRPYHDFLDIMMRMAVNTNQLNEPLVKLSCLAAIEAAPLHFNLFPKFWTGIYNNKNTNKYTELLATNPNLVEYVDILLRDERISLNDPIIRNFLEIYYPKVESIATRLAISRLLYSISYTLHAKDDIDELCGDLHAIRVIAQTTAVPLSVRKQLKSALKIALVKNQTDILDKTDDTPPKKKVKMSPIEELEKQDQKVTKSRDNSTELPQAAINQLSSSSSTCSTNTGTTVIENIPSESSIIAGEGFADNDNEKDSKSSSANITPIAQKSPTSKTSSSNQKPATSASSKDSTLSLSIADEKTPTKLLDESNDADDENDDDESLAEKEKRKLALITEKSNVISPNDTAIPAGSKKTTVEEQREKERCFLRTIEGYIRAILTLIQDEDDSSSSSFNGEGSSPHQNLDNSDNSSKQIDE